jgi:hypothetical protein
MMLGIVPFGAVADGYFARPIVTASIIRIAGGPVEPSLDRRPALIMPTTQAGDHVGIVMR